MSNNQKTIIPFWNPSNKNGYLGNWYNSPFVMDGIEYLHVEMALMAGKALLFSTGKHQDFNLKILDQILSEKDPNKCKKLGSQVKDFDDETWEKEGYMIAKNSCLAKFQQNEDLKTLLLNTGDSILAEASPYDKKWGIGLKPNNRDVYDIKKWQGRNLLGKILMEVREELRN